MEYTIGTKVFKDWEIVGELGQGSYGRVFQLEKTDFGVTAKAALKVIRIPRSQEDVRDAYSEGMDEKSVTSYFEDIVARFMNEIAIMSELKVHPNIVGCEDYRVEPHAGEIGWDILIRMELLTPLKRHVSGPMQEAEAVRLAIDICKALEYCQKKGLIHRDVKPDNVFVDAMGNFKLGDFGVARTAEKTMGGMSKQGTENYMAPEVYLGRPYGASVDIYSLGLMLYRLMNRNRMPFLPLPPSPIGFADRENSLGRRIQGEVLPPPCDASEKFAAIILKACAYNPQERYRTAAEMLEELTGVKAVDTAVDEKGFEQKEVEEFEEEDGSVGTRGVLFRRKRGKTGAEEALPGENPISAAETGDGWSEDRTIGTVGPGFRRRKKDETTGTGIPRNDVIPPEEVPPAATPPGPEIPPAEEKEKSSKRPLLLGGGAAAILALALVVGMPNDKKDADSNLKETVAAVTQEETTGQTESAVSSETVNSSEEETMSPEDRAKLAERKAKSSNPEFVTLNSSEVLYETVTEGSAYKTEHPGKNQVNREHLDDAGTVMLKGKVVNDMTAEEFQTQIQILKKRLDLLGTDYAVGYHDPFANDVAVRIAPEKMGFLVTALLSADGINLESNYEYITKIDQLDYQWEEDCWKLIVTVSSSYNLEKKIKEAGGKLSLWCSGYELTDLNQTKILEISEDSLTAEFVLDCFADPGRQQEFEFVPKLLKAIAEGTESVWYDVQGFYSHWDDNVDSYEYAVLDQEDLMNPNLYQVIYGRSTERPMIFALQEKFPYSYCSRDANGTLLIWLDARRLEKWESETNGQQSPAEYAVALMEQAQPLINYEAFYEEPFNGEQVNLNVLSTDAVEYAFKIRLEKKEGQMVIVDAHTVHSAYKEEFEQLVRASAILGPMMEE